MLEQHVKHCFVYSDVNGGIRVYICGKHLTFRKIVLQEYTCKKNILNKNKEFRSSVSFSLFIRPISL